MPVPYEWDETKNQANIAQGRPSFEAVYDLEWDTAVIRPSPRSSEIRWAAIGYIGYRLHHVVYAHRGGRRRIISLRRASKKEERDYADA